MNEIDLHGFTHDEAVFAAENFVLLESQDELFQCRIITGNSYKMHERIIEMLNKHNFRYYIPSWNTGEIVVSN
jgi:DNA-nicking Smr family endonuclease